MKFSGYVYTVLSSAVQRYPSWIWSQMVEDKPIKVSPTGFAIITRLFLGFPGVLMVLYHAIYKTACSELALDFLKCYHVISSISKAGIFLQENATSFKKKINSILSYSRYFESTCLKPVIGYIISSSKSNTYNKLQATISKLKLIK